MRPTHCKQDAACTEAACPWSRTKWKDPWSTHFPNKIQLALTCNTVYFTVRITQCDWSNKIQLILTRFTKGTDCARLFPVGSGKYWVYQFPRIERPALVILSKFQLDTCTSNRLISENFVHQCIFTKGACCPTPVQDGIPKKHERRITKKVSAFYFIQVATNWMYKE